MSDRDSRDNKKRLLAAALSRHGQLSRQECFDPVHTDSRPTPAQQEVLADFGKVKTQWIVAANQSGKSQICSRIIAWVITGTFPGWKRPLEWGDEPLLILVMGRTGKHLEEVLWPKIRSYLQPGTYKEVKVGNILQKVEFLETGDRIIFQSLENPNTAAERIQSYVAHLVWIDEMPPTVKVLAEAMVRRNSRNGYFLASFTPLVVNSEIRKMVDAAALPHAKKYIFRMFDNPVYSSPEKQAEILADMATLPESVRRTRLYGDWSQADSQVYTFDFETMVAMPPDYSPLWRHVEAVDPALSSALGLTIYAEDPITGLWYMVHAEKIRGISEPEALFRAVQKRTEGKNIVRRISDPHEVWYISTAARLGTSYIGVYKKNDRKGELITGLQTALGTRVRIAPLCTEFVEEIQECRWSDKTPGKIVNGSKYHLLDSAQYFVDNIPKAENKIIHNSVDEYLYKANEKRKTLEVAAMKRNEKQAERRMQIRRMGRTKGRVHM